MTSEILYPGAEWRHKETGKLVTVVRLDYKHVIFRDKESRVTASERKPYFLTTYGPCHPPQDTANYTTEG